MPETGKCAAKKRLTDERVNALRIEQVATEERRKEPRYPLKATLAVVTSDTVSLAATASDVSAGGLRIQTAKAILPGTGVVAFLQLDQEVEFRGTVAWVLEGYDNGQLVYQVGIKVGMIVFSGIKATTAPEQNAVIQEIIRRIGQVKRKRPAGT